MNEQDLLAVLNKIGSGDRDTPYTAIDAFQELKGMGLEYKTVFYHDTVLYEQIWELPQVTAYNEKLGPNGIMGNYFCTLYRVKEEHKDLQIPQYVFTTGRLGNTQERIFSLPCPVAA